MRRSEVEGVDPAASAAHELNTAIGLEYLARLGDYPGDAAEALDHTAADWAASPPGRPVTHLDDAVTPEDPAG